MTYGLTFDLCLWCSVLWKVTMDTGTVSSVLIKIAQRTQPKKLAAFMRRFVDYVILSLPMPSSQDPVSDSPQDATSHQDKFNTVSS